MTMEKVTPQTESNEYSMVEFGPSDSAGFRRDVVAPPPRTCPFSGATTPHRPLKLSNVISGREQFDSLHIQAHKEIVCNKGVCSGALMSGQSPWRPLGMPRPRGEIVAHAKAFLHEYYEALDKLNSTDHLERLAQVLESVDETGTYELTYEELVFGTKLAWRNAPRCIGRIQWNKLHVFDCRRVRTAREMFDALCQHIKYATNDGNLRSAITVFPKREVGKPDFRVWNPQLINYAGYEQPDGSVIGDPARVKLTQICQNLGWKGKGGMFDVLPLVLNASGEDPQYFEIPEELVLEVEMKHPKYPWFEDMGLQWYALPAVADMMTDVGGIEYPACPFNGWYMSSEIGTRNFCDPQRLNVLEDVAVKMGLDTTSNANLWKDQALVEVNVAVLYSFQCKNITIMDHHTASESFMKHFENEQKLRGGCPSDWVWIVPPISGGLTQVFHQEMINYNLKPSYEYQEKAWKTHVWLNKDLEKQQKGSGIRYHYKAVARSILFAVSLIRKCLGRRVKATILYASETGKSETYARRVGEVFKKAFHAEVICMDKYDINHLPKEKLVLIVTSTFGSGDSPDNGKLFSKNLAALVNNIDANNNQMSNRRKSSSSANNVIDERIVIKNFQDGLINTRFGVFALGSTAYPDFCAFGKFCDTALTQLGAQRIVQVGTGDELRGQEQSFKKWLHETLKNACQAFNLQLDATSQDMSHHLQEEDTWAPDQYRLVKVNDVIEDIYAGLSKVHNRKVLPCRMTSRKQLQSNESSRQTILAKFDTKGAEDMSYSPGDHLGVFPANRTELVNGIIRRLKNVPSLTDVLSMQTVDKENSRGGRMRAWKGVSRLVGCTIHTAFTYYLDITTPPSQQLLHLLAKCTTDENDIKRLERLATDDEFYESWKYFKFPNLLEVLEEFPSVKADATLLLSQLPLLQPRFYSISSSQSYQPGEIHATVGVITYRSEEGKGPLHYGVCSSFLNSFPSSDIPCFIRKAPNFHMPQDKSRPLIMVGPGTGIAPFRSFWQQRKYEMSLIKKMDNSKRAWLGIRSALDCRVTDKDTGFGKMTLYFGCRHPDLDDIYARETSELVQQAVLCSVHTAYSRRQERPKRYVQHIVLEEGATIAKQLLREQGHIYVCGEAAMAAEVRTSLKEVFRIHGKMNAPEAEGYLQEMKEEGRFHEDIFGVLVPQRRE